MRTELDGMGISVNIVAINWSFAESSQSSLASRGTFDMLQDHSSIDAWGLLGGGKDDFFIYLEGGRLAPGGYLRYGGPVETNLGTREGYTNLRDRIVAAQALGRAAECGDSAGGLQLPGNLNQDARLDLSDAVLLLGRLFLGETGDLPCEGGTLDSPGNRALLDANGDERVDIADPVHLLNYLFAGGAPPSAGTACTPLAGCPAVCSS